MKEKELIEFMHSLWNRGLMNVSPDEFDYEWVVWDYLKLRQPPVIGSVCTCRNSELEKGSLVPVFCHSCNAYVQNDL